MNKPDPATTPKIGPEIGPEQIALLEQLSNASAVSGDEGAVRRIVLDQVKPHADRVEIDSLGNVLVTRLGSGKDRMRVMLAAHMDEIGFMITQDNDKGIFRFDTVGGIDARQLPGKPVWVGADRIPGVIGAKPIHLTKPSEREQTISIDTLRIDVGPENAKKVKVGDRAVFATPFRQLNGSLWGKAMDDRLGVTSLIELIKHPPAGIDLLAAFTVQEEVGLRGARVAAYSLDPQAAIALDCTPANDLPAFDADEGGKNLRYNTRQGHGPAVYVADGATLSDPRLVKHLIETGTANQIPFQIRQPGGGGTDAGAIHKQRAGIPSVSLSVPGRYLHTAVSLVLLEDWQNTLALVRAALSSFSPSVLAGER